MQKIILILTLCLFNITLSFAEDSVVSLGERLFNEIRFSEYFHKKSHGDVNYKLQAGEESVETMQVGPLSVNSPFSGTAKSCASCHMVDQAFEEHGMRGYNDFATLTKIPNRTDNNTLTNRNTPSLVGIGSKYNLNRISHYDGEFFDHSETVLGNFTGRNMGWLANEKSIALKNIVKVIREDNGQGDLASEFGGSYKKIFLAKDPNIPEELRLPKKYRFNLDQVSDEFIIERVIFFVTEYMNDLDFETDETGAYSGSAYDKFLKLNNIPRAPKENQSTQEYVADLTKNLKNLKNPKFVKKEYFPTQKESFGFEELEWQGLQIFFNLQSKKGMCVNCHTPPLFSDQKFHNIGTSQFEYENIHGFGSFEKIEIPSLKERKENHFFNQRPKQDDPKLVDLGLWNFYKRDDKKELTQYIERQTCGDNKNCAESRLEFMLGKFKTASVRNLGHSAPYMHNGMFDNLDRAIFHYVQASQLHHRGFLKNPSEFFNEMNIIGRDVRALRAFLDSLNENYE